MHLPERGLPLLTPHSHIGHIFHTWSTWRWLQWEKGHYEMVPERGVNGEKCDVCDCEIAHWNCILFCHSAGHDDLNDSRKWGRCNTDWEWSGRVCLCRRPVWGTLYMQFSGPTMFFLDNVVVAKIAGQPVLTLAVVGVVDIACGWWYFPIFIY